MDETKWLSSHSHPLHQIYICVTDFPVTQGGIKEKVINDITTIPAKSWDALAKFKALHLTKYFEWRGD